MRLLQALVILLVFAASGLSTQDDMPLLGDDSPGDDEEASVVLFYARPYSLIDGRADMHLEKTGLYSMRTDGTDEQLLISNQNVHPYLEMQETDGIGEMRLSPDGTRLAVILTLAHRLSSGMEGIPVEAIFHAESFPTVLYLIDLHNSQVEQISDDERYKTGLSWSLNGEYLAYAETS
jgi:hypothetical protein